MANQGQGFDESFEISENLSAKQFFGMKRGTTAYSALLGDTAGGHVLGVLQDTGRDGSSTTEHALIRTSGETKLKIGGTVSIDDPLQIDVDGMFIVATTADEVFARATEAGVDGDIINAQITQEGIF